MRGPERKEEGRRKKEEGGRRREAVARLTSNPTGRILSALRANGAERKHVPTSGQRPIHRFVR
jgi:hypothetical protein